jgi:hypothetical protein
VSKYECQEQIERLKAILVENYQLLLDGTWYEDYDAAAGRLGRIRRAIEGDSDGS